MPCISGSDTKLLLVHLPYFIPIFINQKSTVIFQLEVIFFLCVCFWVFFFSQFFCLKCHFTVIHYICLGDKAVPQISAHNTCLLLVIICVIVLKMYNNLSSRTWSLSNLSFFQKWTISISTVFQTFIPKRKYLCGVSETTLREMQAFRFFSSFDWSFQS